MATSVGNFKLASTANGFTLGFGVLTVWEAIKQTMAIRSPLRGVYIYTVWGEILANLSIGIIAWLFLDGTLGPR
jgi:MFS superfamily sulfate permease-like transporter